VEADGIGERIRQIFAYLGWECNACCTASWACFCLSNSKIKACFIFSNGGAVEMCGRYKRTSDKQRIAEVFHVAAGLDELPDEPGDDLCPQSLQPVIFTNDHGERQIELMRGHSNSPTSFFSMLDRRASSTQRSGRMPF
jgi:hypothetical protein